MTTAKICEKCQGAFTAKHKNRKFCRACRSRESQLSPKYKTRIEYEKTCEKCGEKFHTGRVTARFCTRSCKLLAYRGRQRQK